MGKRAWMLVLTVCAVQNQLFRDLPYIASANSDSVKLIYSLGETIVNAVVNINGEKRDVSQLQTNRFNSSYYGWMNVNLQQGVFNWTLEDFGGQTSICETTLQATVPVVNATLDPCTASGCFEYFQNDGWCDARCLSPACGYDGTDCHTFDVFAILQCSSVKVGDGTCNPECNSPLTFFDGGDCVSPCLQSGCPRLSLGNGICDKFCNNAACDYDHGDCVAGVCSKGCMPSNLGNGVCDSACNTASCDYDNGDCTRDTLPCDSQGSVITDHLCNPITRQSLGCLDSMINNLVCNQECNNPVGDYDGGDCMQFHRCKTRGCNPSDDIGNNKCNMDCFYDECAYDFGECDRKKKVCWNGCLSVFLANGICDEQCNVPQCRFDGGDCASKQCAENCFADWLGDGKCDLPCNVPSCQSDKGDCTSGSQGVAVTMGEVTIAGVRYKAETTCKRSVGDFLRLTLVLFLSFS